MASHRADARRIRPDLGGHEATLIQVRVIARRGILAHPMVYPAVAQNEARIRFFITSEHSDAQIDHTLDIVAAELRAINDRNASVVAG